jgi:hypothetical protein
VTDRELIALMATKLVTSGYARNRILAERVSDAQIATKAVNIARLIRDAIDVTDPGTGSSHLSDDEWLAKIRETRQEVWGDEPTAQPGAKPL